MNKWINKAIVLVSGLALALLGLSPAHAEAPPQLTFQEFITSTGYLDMMATSSASQQYISNQSGIRMTIQSSGFSAPDVPSGSGSIVVEATKTKMKLTSTTEGVSVSSWIIDGVAYYPVLEKLMSGDMPFGIEKRVSGIQDKLLQSNTVPDFMTGYAPDKLFSEADSSLLNNLNPAAEVMQFFTFSEVTKTVNPEIPEKASYDFTMSMNLLGMTQTISQSIVFDGNYISEVSLSLDSNSGASVNVAAVVEVVNDLVIDSPDMSKVITEASINRLSKQMTAEGKLAPKASAIVKKAAALAKQAKKTITSKNLQTAASSLKTKFSKLSDGIKISTTHQSVTGSLCIRVVKGKTVTKYC